MKNIVKSMLLILMGLVFFISVNAQSLVGYTWQLQNPQNFSQSTMLTFGNGGKMVLSSGDLKSYSQPVNYAGTYRLYDDILEIRVGGQVARGTISWINRNKMVIIENGVRFVYAKSGSPEDQFLSNYLKITNGYSSGGYNNSSNGGSYNNSSNSNTVCYTCNGSGRCKVCRGIGRCTMYGQTSLCSACNATGKCWHCYGSGKQ